MPMKASPPRPEVDHVWKIRPASSLSEDAVEGAHGARRDEVFPDVSGEIRVERRHPRDAPAHSVADLHNVRNCDRCDHGVGDVVSVQVLEHALYVVEFERAAYA